MKVGENGSYKINLKFFPFFIFNCHKRDDIINFRVIVMQDKGYTIPELIVVIVVVGIFSIVAINKASYAFVDTDTIGEETEKMILIKSSSAYANSIKEELKSEKERYILGRDLVTAGYLVDDDNLYTNKKVKISYNGETEEISVEILD